MSYIKKIFCNELDVKEGECAILEKFVKCLKMSKRENLCRNFVKEEFDKIGEFADKGRTEIKD